METKILLKNILRDKKETAMVAIIFGDAITSLLYSEMQSQGKGYMDTVDTISEWAIEFVEKHKNTNWENVLEGGMKPLSKQIKSIICWDDVCFDYAHFKLEQFKK